MAVGTSLLLIAAGAILAIAVDYEASGVDIQAIGGILVAVGAVGLLISMLFLASFAPFGTHDTVDRRHGSGHHGHV